MARFSAYIIVIACKRLKKFKVISDILTDYLEGLSHIKKTCSVKDSNTDFYIIADTNFYRILYKFRKITNLRNILGVSFYKRRLYKGNTSYVKYPCTFTFNSEYLPEYMPIPTDDIEYFIIITRD